MTPLIDTLTLAFTQSIHTLFPELVPMSAEIAESSQENFGDYQCNSAMKCAKLTKQNPRLVAEELIKIAKPNLPSCCKMEVAGPGFINIWLDTAYLEAFLLSMSQDPRLGVPIPKHVKQIIVEFSSPNTAKEMHVGHLRSTIIGDTLAKLFEFQGHNVLRLNHIGDWGTAFGMLIAYIKEYFPLVYSGQETTDLSSLVSWYKKSKELFDKDLEFKKRSQGEVVQLQGGNPASLHAWHTICSISRQAYQEIYDLLDIKIQERGESYYNPVLPSMIQELEVSGIIQISDGAKCIFLDGFKNREGEPLPYMVQKSDGGYNYDTTDLAALRQRIVEEKADQIIYVVDAGQSLHFQMLFKAAEKAGYLDPQKTKVCHVPFGLVLGPDGKKFKTRSGETERLIDLLQTAIAKAEEILILRDPTLELQKLLSRSKILGINAIKYADLSCQRTHDYHFSYDRMLRFEGNTAAFLMYAFVRIAGIKRKSHLSIEDIQNAKIHLEHGTEKALGLHLARFPEAIENMAQELLPHRLTEYLFALAEKFHAFFRDCKVVGSPEETNRLQLCSLTSQVLKQGMELLGLHVVDQM